MQTLQALSFFCSKEDAKILNAKAIITLILVCCSLKAVRADQYENYYSKYDDLFSLSDPIFHRSECKISHPSIGFIHTRDCYVDTNGSEEGPVDSNLRAFIDFNILINGSWTYRHFVSFDPKPPSYLYLARDGASYAHENLGEMVLDRKECWTGNWNEVVTEFCVKRLGVEYELTDAVLGKLEIVPLEEAFSKGEITFYIFSMEDRRKIQSSLHSLGYYTGDIDGLFNSLTHIALVEFIAFSRVAAWRSFNLDYENLIGEDGVLNQLVQHYDSNLIIFPTKTKLCEDYLAGGYQLSGSNWTGNPNEFEEDHFRAECGVN